MATRSHPGSARALRETSTQGAVAGFTLIELLVAVAIVGLASAYMFQSFAASNRSYVVIDQVAESQQSARAVAALLEQDLRHTGLMVPEGAAFCGVDDTNGPDLLYVSDAGILDPQDDLVPYEGAEIQGGVTNVAAGAVTLALDSLVIEPPPLRAALDTDADSVNDSDFRPGGGVIIMDFNEPGRGTACGRIDVVNAGAATLDVIVASGALGPLVGTAKLVAVPAHEYRIAGDQLLRDGMLLTEGVEDLQFSVFIDADDDDLIDANEVQGDGVGPDYVALGTDHTDLREVRMNLVTRTRAEDPSFAGQLQATENRVVGGGNDGFRRRVYTSTVMLRNIGTRVL